MKRPVSLAAVLLASAALAIPASAQGTKSSQGSAQVETLSPPAPVAIPQPVGSFPTNQVTGRPYVSPEGGVEGYRKSVAALQRTPTELQQLQLQTKQAHWNVSGTLWYPLHELLQEQYEDMSKYADMCAERMLAIGPSSDGRASTVVRGSALPEIPGGYLDDAQVIARFTNAYKTGEEVRAGIEDADPTTSNLLQEIELNLEKHQWEMRAFVQGTVTDPNAGRDINDGKPIGLPSRKPTFDLNQH